MLAEFIKGFLLGVQRELAPEPVLVPLPTISRPSRKQMKKHLVRAIHERTQYRCKFHLNGAEYHSMYAYIRSAIYTVVYEYVDTRGGRRYHRLVSFHCGKPSLRELREYVRDAIKERKKRADRALATGN